MLSDFYTRDNSYKSYNNDILEINDELSDLIIKIEQLLFTKKGEVLGSPDLGCNLDDMVFSQVLNANYIENNINEQIYKYCTSYAKFNVNVKVSFFQVDEYRNGCLIDVYVNDERVIGALY